MYIMWYILENYATDEDLRYLVDNVEMYFVPLVNPDGWVYNETIHPMVVECGAESPKQWKWHVWSGP